jgi:hypothetical protein
MSEDFQSLIANEVRRKKAAEEAFSQMSFEAFTYSPEAVNKVIGINKDLNRMVVGLDTHTTSCRAWVPKLPLALESKIY